MLLVFGAESDRCEGQEMKTGGDGSRVLAVASGQIRLECGTTNSSPAT